MTVLVGRPAPDFSTAAVLADGSLGDIRLSEVIQGKYGLLFFYPLDFTFVCPSELIALDRRMDAFKRRNVEVIAVSVDSQFTHNAWRNTPIDQGGIGQVNYTIAADVGHHICRAYGVEHPEMSVALRGAFIIDKQGIVRAQEVNDLFLGRDIDKYIDRIDGIEFHETHGEVCPAGWKKGEKGMKPSPAGVKAYLAENAETL